MLIGGSGSEEAMAGSTEENCESLLMPMAATAKYCCSHNAKHQTRLGHNIHNLETPSPHPFTHPAAPTSRGRKRVHQKRS